MRCEKFGCKRNWSWFGFGLAKFGGVASFVLVAELVNKWSYRFCAILVGKCHKCLKNKVWKVLLRKELILVGFWLSQVGWINVFFALVGYLVNKWSYGFCAILVGNCHKCIKNEVWKVWLQKEFILVGFWLTMFGGLAFFASVAKLVNKWSYGFCAILVGNCHNCIKNGVWKGCLQKELILVWFWLSQFRWISFFALVAKLVNKWSYGCCAILVENCHKCIKNEVWKVWLQKELVLFRFWRSQVRWINVFCLGSKIGE